MSLCLNSASSARKTPDIQESRMAKILLVDDEKDMVELLAFNLQEQGHSIATAGAGMEALEKARAFLPDLILLDLMLPDLDGISICEILRRQPATREIPIIMITALGGEIARLAAFDSGVNDYLRKPFSPRELVKHVDGLLRGYESKTQSEKGQRVGVKLGNK